jgi:hypothetical protein
VATPSNRFKRDNSSIENPSCEKGNDQLSENSYPEGITERLLSAGLRQRFYDV